MVRVVQGEPVIITDPQIRSIQAPTLMIAGDRDPYDQTAKVLEIYNLLPHGQLMIVPGSGHLVLYRKPQLTIAAIAEFLDKDGALLK